jgi:hypothetical protein
VVQWSRHFKGDDTISSIKEVQTSGVAVLAVARTPFTGIARLRPMTVNAALVGGLVVGRLIDGMASLGQRCAGAVLSTFDSW